MKTRDLPSAVTPHGAAIARSAALLVAARRALAGDPLPAPVNRVADDPLLDEIRSALRAERARLAEKYVRELAADPARAAFTVLRRAATYRTRSGFNDPAIQPALEQQIRDALTADPVIALVLPVGGGKVPNATKTGTGYAPDLGEHVAWNQLAALADALGRVLGKPVVILTIPDAPLHTADLGFPAAEVFAHKVRAAADLTVLDIHNVKLVDTLAHLPGDWLELVTGEAERARRTAAGDRGARESADAQIASLLYSADLRGGARSFAEQVLVTAALAGAPLPLPADVRAEADALRRRVEANVWTYIGVNRAIRLGKLVERVALAEVGATRPIRLTVHAKPGEARPLLMPSSRLARPGLLPMHGVGVFERDAKGLRIATAFELEMRVAELEEPGRVTRWVGGDGRLLAYELRAAAPAARAAA